MRFKILNERLKRTCTGRAWKTSQSGAASIWASSRLAGSGNISGCGLPTTSRSHKKQVNGALLGLARLHIGEEFLGLGIASALPCGHLVNVAASESHQGEVSHRSMPGISAIPVMTGQNGKPAIPPFLFMGAHPTCSTRRQVLVDAQDQMGA
jgi:hypothetical protein